MDKGVKKESGDSSGDNLSILESIRALAAKNARAELNTEEQLLLFLQSWWSRTYNRPLKDPLLLSYSLEELLYEFYDRIERTKAEEERIQRENDRIEEEKEKAALDWAEQEEKKELEAMMAEAAKQQMAEAAKQQSDSANQDPTKDPANIAWMEEQIRQAKEIYGESFGEDIDETFE
jgi:hypothetical protein